MASSVPPALTTIFLPEKSPSLPNIILAELIMLEGSTILPCPIRPEASLPLAGPAIKTPLVISVVTFAWVAALSNMLASIAGAIIIGALVARIVVVRTSSEMPLAILAIVLAVVGATIMISAVSASATWFIESSDSDEYRSVNTDL